MRWPALRHGDAAATGGLPAQLEPHAGALLAEGYRGCASIQSRIHVPGGSLEWELQQQGFDYCYDKRLYDRLSGSSAEQVRQHLLADINYQNALVRIVENHDEPRAVTAFGTRRAPAIALATLTQTGARLVHDGQQQGRRVRLPVFLGRFPAEPINNDLAEFYRSFLAALADPTFRTGQWSLCDRTGWPGNDSFDNLVAWSWDGQTRWLIVVNLSDETASGLIRAPWQDLRDHRWRLVDPTQDVTFDRDGDDLVNGLYVELDGWHWHLLRVDRA